MVERSIGTQFGPRTDFRVGDALTYSLRLYGKNFASFTTISVVAFIPTLFYSVPLAEMNAQIGTNPGNAPVNFWSLVAQGSVLEIILIAVVHCLINIMTFDRVNGRPVTFSNSVMTSLSRLLQFTGTLILIYITVGIGLFLLVVPGIIWTIMSSVALPVCAIEKRGPFDAFSRSRALTKGHRWKLLVTLLIPFVAFGIANHILLTNAIAIYGATIATIIALIEGSIINVYFAVLSVVIYRNLAIAAGEIPGASFARVFD
jgi:hypothetical protein